MRFLCRPVLLSPSSLAASVASPRALICPIYSFLLVERRLWTRPSRQVRLVGRHSRTRTRRGAVRAPLAPTHRVRSTLSLPFSHPLHLSNSSFRFSSELVHKPSVLTTVSAKSSFSTNGSEFTAGFTRRVDRNTCASFVNSDQFFPTLIICIGLDVFCVTVLERTFKSSKWRLATSSS